MNKQIYSIGFYCANSDNDPFKTDQQEQIYAHANGKVIAELNKNELYDYYANTKHGWWPKFEYPKRSESWKVIIPIENKNHGLVIQRYITDAYNAIEDLKNQGIFAAEKQPDPLA